ncbi:MAG: hypothetical protein JWM81_1184 [Candidatus Saccharibacteria bacterium]|nr:hypothetical protein [Candidatus Saccharibacteria bacterium]
MGLTGSSGTGKSTISKHLASKRGLFVEEGSVLIRRAASERGQSLSSRADYEAVFRAEQRSRGMTWLSDSLLASNYERKLQGGLRAQCDFLNLKKASGFIVALVCPIEICLERIDTSNPKNPRTAEEYIQHQAIENTPDQNGYGTHTSWCVENADYTIDTSGPLDVTLAEIDALIIQI